MKSINEIIESYQFIDTYVNENKTDTIKDIVSNEDIGYIKDYGKSLEVGQKINELDMYDSKNGACLYSDGRLIFFMIFNDLSQMTKFFMTFYKYEDKFTGEENPKDGKWHLYFDAHGDPGTGIDDKHIKFNLCYNAKTNKISEIDNAINELIDLLNKKSDWYKSINN